MRIGNWESGGKLFSALWITVITTAALRAPAAEFGGNAQAGTAPVNPRINDAPVNTWVRLGTERTGARGWPVFYFDPNLGRFVLARERPGKRLMRIRSTSMPVVAIG